MKTKTKTKPDSSSAPMGFEGKMSYSDHPNSKVSVVFRVSQLPLVRSTLQSVTSAFTEVKGRYALLGLVGWVAEVGVRSVTMVAMRQATPLLQSLEPQIEVANSFALVSLDRLERNFPVLHQSADEVMGHLKDAFFFTLDDVRERVVEGLDGALDRLERASDAALKALRLLQDSQVGRATTTGLDEVLSRVEEATAYYLPLPPTLRREWEMRVQDYEDEDEDEEPGLWTRFRSLLLNLSLQLHHRMLRLRRQLGGAADTVGLQRVLELLADLLEYLRGFMVAVVYRVEGLRELALAQVKGQAAMLAGLRPVQQILTLPREVQQLLRELQELAKILLQFTINATPLYNMLQQPTEQEVEDFLNQEDFMTDGSLRRGSANSLFLKAMDGRPRRRRSLHSRVARRPSAGSVTLANSSQSPGSASSLKQDATASETEAPPLPSDIHRRPSATELLLTPLKQFVTQSQRAFEYLNPGPSSPNNMAEP